MIYPCYKFAQNDNDSVGLWTEGDNLIISFPTGYKSDEISKVDVQDLIRLMSISKNNKWILNENETPGDEANFPIYDYLYVLNYFVSHDYRYYYDVESTYEIRDSGKISWSKTIKTVKPLFENDQAFYLKTIRKHNTPNDNNLITLINEFCVYEACYFFGGLYSINVEKPNEYDNLKDQLDYLINYLNKRIAQTYVDSTKTLFLAMLAILERDRERDDTNQFTFRTNNFHVVWENIVDQVFGTVFDDSKKNYNPRFEWVFFDKDGNRQNPSNGNTSVMVPDTINITDGKLYIIDAKYYPFGIHLDKPSANYLPNAESLFKQFHYIEYAVSQKNKNQYPNIDDVNKISPFIIPFECKGDNSTVLQVRGAVKQGEYYVLAVLLDTKYAIKVYLNGFSNNKKNLRSSLIKMIDDKDKDLYKSLFILDK